jgi:aldose sugar dehydrogenase
MMDRSRIAAAATAIGMFGAAGAQFLLAQQAALELETQTNKIRVVTLVAGLDKPWSIAFLPDGDFLVTELPGNVRLIHDGVAQAPMAGAPKSQLQGHGGMLDIELHPDFRNNHFVYIAYSKAGEKGVSTAIFRARYEGSQLVDGKDIFVADAWAKGGLNPGGRMLFDKKGYLYFGVGDRGPTGEQFVQDLTVHHGKILRLKADGSVPEDNPFVNRPGAKPEIFTYGNRTPQGLTVHPDTGEIWESEHGPMGGDEVNVLKPGANYGWPVVSYGRKYDGSLINSGQPWKEGMEPPAYFWVPSIGISNILFYMGDQFPSWKGQLIVTGMSGRLVQTVRQKGRGQNERESILTQLRREFRDIRQGPDGLIYLVVRQDAKQTKNSGAILRIEPVK